MVDIVHCFVHGYSIFQQTKDSTNLLWGKLAPILVPMSWFYYWTMDFTTGLPLDAVCNAIYTCVDKLSKIAKVIPWVVRKRGPLAPATVELLFNYIICSCGVPYVVLPDRGPRFRSSFWITLFELLGSCLVSFHIFYPRMDG